MRRVSSASPGNDDEPARRPSRRRAVQVFRRLDRPHRQGRTAACQAAAAARRRAQRRGHAWEWATEKHYLHDLIASDRRNPTVNAYGPLYGSPEYSTDNMPILDPKTHKVTTFKMPVRDANTPESLGRRDTERRALKPLARRPIGARRRSGTRGPTTTTACSTRRAACGSPRRCAASTIRPSARRARTILRRKRFRSNARAGRWRCSIPRPRSTASSTPASARITRSSATTPTTRCGFRQRSGRRLGQHEDVGRDRRRAKAQGWAPFVLDTNGNGKRDEYVEPGQPVGSGQGQADRRAPAPTR